MNFVLMFVFVAAFTLLFTPINQWLINTTFSPSAIKSVFGVEQIGFWQTLTLGLACSFLFRSNSGTSSKS